MAIKRQIENENAMAYIQGIYIAEAILSTVGNQLSDKHSKKFEYPDKPIDFNFDGNKEEREKESQLEKFTASLNMAMNNFNLRQSKEQG